jgi:hypothetical protein
VPHGRGLRDQIGTSGFLAALGEVQAAFGEVAVEGGVGQVDRPAAGV